MIGARAELSRLAKRLVLVGLLLGIPGYLASGLFRVQLGEQALRLRFGRVVAAGIGPGIHYHLPAPFGAMRRTNLKRVRQVRLARRSRTRSHGLQYFTGDENLVRIDAAVQYVVEDLAAHGLLQAHPAALVRELGIASLAAEVATHPVDVVFTSHKVALQSAVARRLQRQLDGLWAGVRVLSVHLVDVAPPRAVAEAFRAANSAREESHKLVTEARAEANGVLSGARGQVRALLDQSEAQRSRKLDRATARTRTFAALSAQAAKQPQSVRRERWLTTLARLRGKVRFVLDAQAPRSLYGLPGRPVPVAGRARRPRSRPPGD